MHAAAHARVRPLGDGVGRRGGDVYPPPVGGEAAGEVVDGLKSGCTEILVERARLLATLMRVAPEIGERMMRRG